jgi:hypothetical protein
MARGLPLEGERAGERRAIDFAGPSVVTCALDDTIGQLRGPVAESAYDFALVLWGEGVVLGRVWTATIDDAPDARAEEAMEPGPPTSRPDISAAKLRERLEQKHQTVGILTAPDGTLLAVVPASELEQPG